MGDSHLRKPLHDASDGQFNSAALELAEAAMNERLRQGNQASEQPLFFACLRAHVTSRITSFDGTRERRTTSLPSASGCSSVNR